MNEYGHIYLDRVHQDNAGRWYATLRQDSSGDGSWVQIPTPRRNDREQMLKDVDFAITYEGDLMNIFSTNLFEYLAGEMFLDKNGAPKAVTLTMKDVKVKTIANGRGGDQENPVLSFKERDKLLVLNKTNARTIAALYGPETSEWAGKRITITGEHGAWFGKKGVRVVVLDSVATNGKVTKKPVTPAVTEDDIDFEQDALFEDELTGGAFAE
jgi:hypothetical protein